jgi:hypothetical protein
MSRLHPLGGGAPWGGGGERPDAGTQQDISSWVEQKNDLNNDSYKG